MTRAILATALLAAATPWATADEVLLKGGGRIVGEVVERNPRSVVVDVGPGTVALPMSRVERIVSTTSRLTEFRDRAARLDRGDIPGWLALAAWADRNDLRTQARGAWEHVLSVDPANAVAQRALGNVWHADRWMEPSDAMRAQGLVEFEGQWMSPGERETRLRVQAAEAVAMRENALADARIAEAEARAREAEARAHAAEVDAERADGVYGDGGIPFGYAYGGGGYGIGYVDPFVGAPPVRPCCGAGHEPGLDPGRRPRPDPAPRPSPQPRDGSRTPPPAKTSTRGTHR
jgi:hypothetical protein